MTAEAFNAQEEVRVLLLRLDGAVKKIHDLQTRLAESDQRLLQAQADRQLDRLDWENEIRSDHIELQACRTELADWWQAPVMGATFGAVVTRAKRYAKDRAAAQWHSNPTPNDQITAE